MNEMYPTDSNLNKTNLEYYGGETSTWVQGKMLLFNHVIIYKYLKFNYLYIVAFPSLL